jgi:hypothetical protein
MGKDRVDQLRLRSLLLLLQENMADVSTVDSTFIHLS